MSQKVFIVRTGAANLGSITAGFARIGTTPIVTENPYDIETAEFVIIPGVGSFGSAMGQITSSGMAEQVKQRYLKGLPTAFVCVGLQVLANESEESPGVKGLGVVDSPVIRFPLDVHVPQQGWNKVVASTSSNYITSGYAYFSNSFCLSSAPSEGWAVSTAQHGIPFVAAIERGAFLACQFHPELSGEWGLSTLKRWIEKSPQLVLPGAKRPLPPSLPSSLPLNSSSVGVSVTPLPQAPTATGLTRRIIPCLDVKDGKVVKGIKFQNLQEAGSPADRAEIYQNQGGDELVMLDVSATVEGRRTALETIKSIRQRLFIPLTVGGGIKTIDDAQRILEAGADKVSINTAAVRDPTILTSMAEKFGRQCTVLAIDAIQDDTERWIVVVASGKEKTPLDVVQWAQEGVKLGAGEILLTSWDRDGTKSGYDCELLRRVSAAVHVPVIASGGAANPSHLAEALTAGADAVLAASIFHYAEYTVEAVKSELKANYQIRA